MFGIVKKSFFEGLAFLSSLTSVNSLSCISMNNQECNVMPQIVKVNSDDPMFFLLALKQVNVVIIVTILMNCMQKAVLLML